jgi:hypothetical protein
MHLALLFNVATRNIHNNVFDNFYVGWEPAEVEATAIKKLLEAASQRNVYLESQVNHLDKALKECVR